MIGMPLDLYIREYLKVAPDMLKPSSDTLTEVTFELYALSLLSIDGASNPVQALQPYIAKICTSEQYAAQMQRELLKINTERTRDGQTPVSN
jgi:hypothetical protein